jgi:hypothetical protein
MESLVSRMESVAQRISARDTSASQRSVLVSRFNDLTRRVNLLDGIVGGEGQEVRGRRALRLGNGRQADPGSARVESRRRLVGARPPGRVDRPDRHFVQAREVGPVRETPITAQAVRELRQGIERQGLAVIGERRSTGALLDFLA